MGAEDSWGTDTVALGRRKSGGEPPWPGLSRHRAKRKRLTTSRLVFATVLVVGGALAAILGIDLGSPKAGPAATNTLERPGKPTIQREPPHVIDISHNRHETKSQRARDRKTDKGKQHIPESKAGTTIDAPGSLEPEPPVAIPTASVPPAPPPKPSPTPPGVEFGM